MLLPSSFDATMLADFLPLDIGSWLGSTTVAWKFVLQLVIIVAVAALIYAKIHGTYAAKLLQGLAFVMGCYLLADILDLNILHQILGVVLQILIIGFIILFQPELGVGRGRGPPGPPDRVLRDGRHPHDQPGVAGPGGRWGWLR